MGFFIIYIYINVSLVLPAFLAWWCAQLPW